ncbi:Pentatricopeptide repeat-containing protein [Dorcoceras hygrometricum]|uniref:Pentatricopeptide repeat-containing protein n=1 Tax=Dorcoceras hygrometricum TaxID=472368 RepID=A0A2Z7DEN8_9LAMI|nr:Pentatricopeptide repeat-containing protein [Dorcoceras hygrometricum]
MRPLHLITETSLSNFAKVAVSHCQFIKASLITDTYTANNLIHRYVKCKESDTALKVFGEMTQRDTASWNTIITGYVNSGDFMGAWEVLKTMKRHGYVFDGYTFGSMLKGIGAGGELMNGQQVHSDVVKLGFDENVYAASSLLDMYVKCGEIADANRVFDFMLVRNSVSWNALIAGYADFGDFFRCLKLFRCMDAEGVRVDDASFAPLLTLLHDVEFYELMRQFHGKIMKLGLDFENTVLNAMITAYSECGCIEDSCKVFGSADGCRDLVTWNSMLAAYIQSDLEECGLHLFLEMMRLRLELDAFSYSSILSGCFGGAVECQGKTLHGLVMKKGLEQLTQVSNALISMYLKSNSCAEENAVKVFEQMNVKDLVSWNTILTGLSQNGLSEYALRLFQRMHLEYLEIDQYTFAAAIRSCSDLATHKMGRQIHVLVLKSGFEGNEFIVSAMIFMYSKCGMVDDAWKSFEGSHKSSSVTWNSIIFGYAQHGQGKIALDLFSQMGERQVKMDHITFVAVLTACSHIGLVDVGLNILQSMELRYGVVPQMENFACAVDLLGRAGRLMEAKELIEEMPFEPDAMVWKTLLGACRACGDIKLATQIASHLLDIEPGEHCTYVLLSDMYGHLKRWNEKASVKRLMRQMGVKKVPGWSWIELNGDVHAFIAEDHSHLSCQEIYQNFEELTCVIKISHDVTALEDIMYPAIGC